MVMVATAQLVFASILVGGLVQPAAPVAEQRDRYSQSVSEPSAARRADWWRSFGDPHLDQLVGRGREQSYDVAAATSRIDEADAVVRQNLAPLLPQLTWDTSVSVAPLDSLGFQFGGAQSGGAGMPGQPMDEPPTLYYSGSSALNLGVDLDVAGGQRLARRASQRDVAATKADLDAALLSLTASIVAAYYDVVTARAQLEISERQLATNREVLALTEARFSLGQASAVGCPPATAATCLGEDVAAQSPHSAACIRAAIVGAHR